MLYNLIKTAFRNLWKHKSFTALNVIGLSIGMASCLLMFQYVAYEKSYDTFNKKKDQIFRIRLDQYKQGNIQWKSATAYAPMGPALKRDFPEVKSFCRLFNRAQLLSYDKHNVKFKETKGYYADPAAIDILGIDLIDGNKSNALEGVGKMVISKTMAQKYFGNEEPVGKILTLKENNNVEPLEVTGVFNDYPPNSHLVIDYILSYKTLQRAAFLKTDKLNLSETSWIWYDFYTYLELQPGADYKALEAKFPAFCDRYFNQDGYHKANSLKDYMYLMSLTDIHLHSNLNQEAEVNGDARAVFFLFLIAIFVIAIAWINYINLATARSVERAKEVGVRKVVGALKINLISQFMLEGFLFNFIALLIAICLVFLLKPIFDQILKAPVPGNFSLPYSYAFLFIAIFLTGSFISGLYPAFVLSAYQPIKVLKGAFKNTAKGLILRKGLIIVQFASSVILIAGTIIVFQQVSFMRRQHLGVNINQTLVIEGAYSVVDSLYQNEFAAFRNEVAGVSKVKSFTAFTSIMGKEIIWAHPVRALRENNGSTSNTLYHLGIDYDFLSAYGLPMRSGRNFSKDFPSDDKAVMLNESAARLLGFNKPDDAINQKVISMKHDTLTVTGVVADYHHMGMQKSVDPMLFTLRKNIRNFYSIKIESKDVPETIARIKTIWSNYFPGDPFNYFFLNDYFDKQYKADEAFGKLFGFFASIAILIACCGLLGLSAYNVLQRTKEISIRKVIGAPTSNLLYILCKDFLKLVLVSFIIAIPICWYLMHNWLENYAYRVSISLWVFIISGLITLIIALSTIGFQSIKAVMASPIKSLKSE